MNQDSDLTDRLEACQKALALSEARLAALEKSTRSHVSVHTLNDYALSDTERDRVQKGKTLRGEDTQITPESNSSDWHRTDLYPFTESKTGALLLIECSVNVTHRKEQEALLENISANLDDFASLTSHDLQAPLRHIGIFAEMLEAEYSEVLNDTGKSFVSEIRVGVDTMRELIAGFLKFMRVAPNGVSRRAVNLKDVMVTTLDTLTDGAHTNDKTITLPDEDIWVRGDAALLSQAMTILFDNAIRYQDPKHKLAVNVSAKSQDGQWEIIFQDNGLGVDPDIAPNIFNLFGRGKPTSGPKSLSVGLSLCHRIMVLHGGSVELEESPVGARFVLTLKQDTMPTDI